MFQENNARQIFRKTNISYPLIRTSTCAYQGVGNIRFSENLACFFLKHPFWDSPFCLITTDIVKSKTKKQLIWQIHFLFKRRFKRPSLVHFQALLMKKLSYKYYNKWITTHDNNDAQSDDPEESKLNNINTNSGAHTLAHDKILKSPFNKNNVATMKCK